MIVVVVAIKIAAVSIVTQHLFADAVVTIAVVISLFFYEKLIRVGAGRLRLQGDKGATNCF